MFRAVTFPVDGIPGRGRYYERPGARAAVLWVGGVGGGWDTPARGLYPELCERLLSEDISSLRVRFRDPTDLAAATRDVVTGVGFLQEQGARSVGLVGHSFGGAVVIQAAAGLALVRSVVTLATQAYGTEAVGRLPASCAVLLLHGEADRILHPLNSQDVYRRARTRRQLVLYPGAGHGLDEVAAQVKGAVHTWLVETLVASTAG